MTRVRQLGAEPLARDRVFISYRRTDSIAAVTALRQSLVQRFGAAAVFHDLTGIPLGVPFPDHLMAELRRAAVVLAVIGRSWLTVTGASSRRRIEEPDDWVHVELKTALSDDHVMVIPVLVDGAPLPAAEVLPSALSSLSSLGSLQAVAVSYEAWDRSVEPLLDRIDELLGPGSAPAAARTRFRPS